MELRLAREVELFCGCYHRYLNAGLETSILEGKFGVRPRNCG